MPPSSPEHLRINGREKLPANAFMRDHKLYRGFCSDDYNESENLDINSISFPDISCNWELFSSPEDIKFRKNGRLTDGCYNVTVETAQYKGIATPVHNPLIDDDYENYSHVEIRELYEEETIGFEPPRKRKKKNPKYKQRRMEYRYNMVKELNIEFYPD